MDLRELLAEIEKLQGNRDCAESARMLLLLALQDPSLKQYSEPTSLRDHYREIELRMHAAADQHAAVAEELDSLASSAPCEFTPDHVWTLIRAIKVQSSLLDMYLGPCAVDQPMES